MGKTQIVTLRMPEELKQRLEREAKNQGVSVNQLATYLLNVQITQLEMLSALEQRLRRKSVSGLKSSVSALLQKVPSREPADWDRVE